MRVLLTGGAGFIGSHTAVRLIGAGHDVEIVDNFCNSKPEVIRRIETITSADVPAHLIDLKVRDAVSDLRAGGDFAAVVHFAAPKVVSESVERPLTHYDHNMNVTFSLLSAMEDHGPRTLVFSSSATVYGDQAPPPFHENQQPLESKSPYGRAKIMAERLLADVAEADPPWRIAVLRYFNPVGAHPSGLIGEDPSGTPSNLVPCICVRDAPCLRARLRPRHSHRDRGAAYRRRSRRLGRPVAGEGRARLGGIALAGRDVCRCLAMAEPEPGWLLPAVIRLWHRGGAGRGAPRRCGRSREGSRPRRH